MITINLEKAKEIKRNKIRAQRAPLLAELDIAFMRAVELGDLQEQQRIAIEKQRLRDAPSDERINSAQTPEELLNLQII